MNGWMDGCMDGWVLSDCATVVHIRIDMMMMMKLTCRLVDDDDDHDDDDDMMMMMMMMIMMMRPDPVTLSVFYCIV